MRLTGTEDTDIRMDRYGQLMADNNGDCVLCSGMACWMQDIWIEMLTEEGELLWEDEEGQRAYGYSLLDFIQAEQDEVFDGELCGRIREKLVKREEIDEASIVMELLEPKAREWAVHVQFRQAEGEMVGIDIQSDGKEVAVT